MATNAPPSIDPADTNSLAGTLRAVTGKWLQSIDDMLPARVVAYDRATNRASVQPLMMMVTTAGDKVQRAQISSVPVLTMGSGAFLLSFPIEPGDLGWIKASDRDISLFLQSLDEDEPNTRRMHSFQDGLFIPDVMRAWTLNAADTESAVLQSADGTVRVSLGAATITLTAPTVIIDAPTTMAMGTIVATGDVTAGGISLMTHKHGGVQAGGANTGVPLP